MVKAAPGGGCSDGPLAISPLTSEISQKQAEQSHVLQGTTGTILSEQRYAEPEVLASLYSVPHGREENYERVYPI